MESDAAPGVDIDAAVASIAHEIFPHAEAPAEPDSSASVAGEATPTDPTTNPEPSPVRAVPKSWPADMHEHWGKVDPKVQEYWETREKQMLDGLDQYKTDAQYAKALRDAMAPHQATLRNQGVSEVQAIQYLLQAHERLTSGTPETRKAAYQELGRSLGFDGSTPSEAAAPVDPVVAKLQAELHDLRTGLNAQQQATMTAAHAESLKQVEAFASDPAHPYFHEAYDDIVRFVQQGLSLQDAYEKAVWATATTRAKEIARVQTEHEAKLKENARLDALPKKKAASVNVRPRETAKAPTEPLGSWEETLRQTYAELKARAS